MKRAVICLAFAMAFSFSARAEDPAKEFSSENLTSKAAEALAKEDWKSVKTLTQKCISLYKAEALRMSRKLKGLPSFDLAPTYWALNDVGYAYFLQGEMYLLKKEYEKAREKYLTVIEKFPFAQKYDPAIGGDWKVAEASKQKLAVVEIELEKAGKAKKGLPSMGKLPTLKPKP